MDTFQYLMDGFQVALMPKNLLIALIGAFIGTIVGLLPGLGPINGVALLLPFAFALGLPPESALDFARCGVFGLRIRRPYFCYSD